jgi:hypothetical protein
LIMHLGLILLPALFKSILLVASNSRQLTNAIAVILPIFSAGKVALPKLRLV